MIGSRYVVGNMLAQGDGRLTSRGRDLWTGREVVLKTGEPSLALREARCLLALPDGLAPELMNLVVRGPEDSTLVLESLDGSTLKEAIANFPPLEVPLLARAICQSLAEIHRTGWLHADIKPENILVMRTGVEPDVRLLDFGFAIELFGASDIRDRGGTPPYMAPELRKGWIVDGRADLYSLGVLLEEILPDHVRDARWEPILEKLLQEIPGRRPASAVALRDEIDRVFDLEGISPRLPRFGSGPVRGRAAEIASIRNLAIPGARILIQARPGTGLSRFLMEAIIEISASGGPPARAVDLSEVRSDEGLDRALESIDRSAEGPEVILCGIPDPSPGLRWLEEPVRARLSRIVARTEWRRLSLPALDTASYREIIISSMGAIDPFAGVLARELHDRTEGDLHRAADGFLQAVRGGGSENGSRWTLDRNAAQAALAQWESGPRPSSLRQMPPSTVASLRICARAGRACPAEIAGALLDRFGAPAALVDLLESGLLVAQAESRLEFVTASVWREALAEEPPGVAEIDRWLNERFDPPAESIEEVLHACALARRCGDRVKESNLLSLAFASAFAQRRYPDLLTFLAYPDTSRPLWTVEAARGRIKALLPILGPDWGEDRLVAVVGVAIRSVDVAIGVQLMEEAAKCADPRAAVHALTMLADRASIQPDNPEFDRYVDALREWQGVPSGTHPGVVEYLFALRSHSAGKMEDAGRLAAEAMKKLRGSGHIYEAMSLQMHAALEFTRSPESAIDTLSAALGIPTEPETEAQIRYNLAIMYDRTGMPEQGLATTGGGLRRLPGRATPARISYLQVQRCHELVLLDRIDQAREEILSLLSLPSNRFMPIRLISLLADLTFCHLHRGNEQECLRQAVTTLAASQGAPKELHWGVVADLVDVLIDLERPELIRDHAPSFPKLPADGDAGTRIHAAGADALRLQADGCLEEAATRLESVMPEARGSGGSLERARALHQLGSIRLAHGTTRHDRESLGLARSLFEEELAELPSTGYGYYRVRAWLALGRTLHADDDPDGAVDTLTRAVDLARELKCLRLLSLGLQARARAEMEPL